MDRFLFCLFFLTVNSILFAQISSTYTISFENAVHHEAFVEATFSNLKADAIYKKYLWR